MTNTATTQNVPLTNDDLRLLVQSLDHCLATCGKSTAGQEGPCEDCARAKALRERLAKPIAA